MFVLLEWIPRLYLCFVLYDMRLVNTFIITIYGVLNYLLRKPNVLAFYVNLNEI